MLFGEFSKRTSGFDCSEKEAEVPRSRFQPFRWFTRVQLTARDSTRVLKYVQTISLSIIVYPRENAIRENDRKKETKQEFN